LPPDIKNTIRMTAPNLKLRASVGQRLVLLIVGQTAALALIVFLALYMHDSPNGRYWVLASGVIGALISLTLGVLLYHAVVPRARMLIDRVRQFQDTGVHERIGDMGNDPIGVLANALDAGFAAIANRTGEREQFFSIVAHELKTPLTSIQGYSSLVMSRPEAAPLLFRALEVINRQSWKMSRLIDGMLLAVRARSNDLHFVPKQFDMSQLVVRVIDDIRPFVGEKAFSAQIQKNVSILGDEALLEEALWSLLTSASALSTNRSPVNVSFATEEWRAVVVVGIDADGTSVPEMEELFQPFQSIEYRDGDSLRFATGLYLCREIVRIHNGHLRVQQVSARPEFVIDLPV
jgi:signal transduction histidine kinase